MLTLTNKGWEGSEMAQIVLTLLMDSPLHKTTFLTILSKPSLPQCPLFIVYTLKTTFIQFSQLVVTQVIIGQF